MRRRTVCAFSGAWPGGHFSGVSGHSHCLLPEYELVICMEGIGKVAGPQLMAEVGDVRRFSHKGALVAYAGVDASPYQS